MRQFAQTFDRIERLLKDMLKRVGLIRQLDVGKQWEFFQEQLLRLEDQSERFTLLTRALPCYTGTGKAAHAVQQVIQDVVPVEMGFTDEGWFCLRIPMLLPKKGCGSVQYLRGFLYPEMSRFFNDLKPVRYSPAVMIFRHVYDRTCPERRYRDHDNIEINLVADTVALYTLPDDSPKFCSHYYCSASAEKERTEVYVVPESEFPIWFAQQKCIPDGGVLLHDNPQIEDEKHM